MARKYTDMELWARRQARARLKERAESFNKRGEQDQKAQARYHLPWDWNRDLEKHGPTRWPQQVALAERRKARKARMQRAIAKRRRDA